MYNEGDLIVYGASGVCRVGGKSVMDGKDYLVLHPLYQRETIYMPLFSNKVFSRPVITKEEAENLISSAAEMVAEPVYESKVQLLSQRYEGIVKICDCAQLMWLIISIHNKKINAEKNKRKLGNVDERYLKKAEDLLYGELAAVLGVPKDKVQASVRFGAEE